MIFSFNQPGNMTCFFSNMMTNLHTFHDLWSQFGAVERKKNGENQEKQNRVKCKIEENILKAYHALKACLQNTHGAHLCSP